MTTSSDFPVLDADRAADGYVCHRAILDVFPAVEARVPDLDNWVSMPVRLAHSQAAGMYLEVGPYDLDRTAIDALRRAVAAYDAAVRPQEGR